jgi:hypothetical protein
MASTVDLAALTSAIESGNVARAVSIATKGTPDALKPLGEELQGIYRTGAKLGEQVVNA